MIGQTISHYRLLEKLGAGGMGVVYKAEDTRLSRAVALKFLPEDLAHDPQALERFRREAHAASALNHPNICTIYDVGEQNGLPFMAMEFIDGETLRQYIAGKPLPTARVLELAIQIADALDAAHAEGIIHRDIKPGNIFVTKRGQAKVLDFGLAKLVRRDGGVQDRKALEGALAEPLSMIGVISGTPSYMSPEQIRGDDLDPRTDLFGLGLLVYEMATGHQAFPGKGQGAIIEAVLTRSPTPARSLNPELPPKLEEIVGKLLEKNRDQRYQSASVVLEDLRLLRREFETGQMPTAMIARPPAARAPHRYAGIAIAGGALVVIGLAAGAWLYSARRAHALSETDTVVLADFANKTGDAVFDDTLQQGLAVQLEQSPFLSLVSEGRVQQTLELMGQSPGAKLTPSVARGVCQRTGSKAYLSGSIANLGSQYVIGLSAVNCATGDSLVTEQVEAAGKEKVLDALGRAASGLREKLGESLSTVEKLDTPIEQATTPSIEALQSYSLARKTMLENADFNAALPLFQHAISLDPNFAMAYASLGTVYRNLGEGNLAAENIRKAHELGQRVSEREKFYIESHYQHFATGDLEKARQVYELWARTYPREPAPHTNLGVIDQSLGQHEKALAEFQEALRLTPGGDGLDYSDLVVAEIDLNRLADAWAAAKEAQAKNLDSPDLRLYVYELDFLQNDAAKMAEQVAEAAGKRGEESLLLHFAAGTAAYRGELPKARELSRQAVASAERAEARELAARFESGAAIWEGLFGDAEEARREAARTLALSNSMDAESMAALALAFAGDSSRAQELASDIAKRFPEDTIAQLNYLPAIRAQVALNRRDPANAIGELQVALPYELGAAGGTTFTTNLFPVHVRGEAYRAAGQGAQAAAEFQKLIDFRGIVLNEPIGALADLGLARSYALAGDVAKARAAYEKFFDLWKNADRDVPVLKQARAEMQTLSEGKAKH
jgi:eukaryotic-like serine/threonine-protein kinase